MELGRDLPTRACACCAQFRVDSTLPQIDWCVACEAKHWMMILRKIGLDSGGSAIVVVGAQPSPHETRWTGLVKMCLLPFLMVDRGRLRHKLRLYRYLLTFQPSTPQANTPFFYSYELTECRYEMSSQYRWNHVITRLLAGMLTEHLVYVEDSLRTMRRNLD